MRFLILCSRQEEVLSFGNLAPWVRISEVKKIQKIVFLEHGLRRRVCVTVLRQMGICQYILFQIMTVRKEQRWMERKSFPWCKR